MSALFLACVSLLVFILSVLSPVTYSAYTQEKKISSKTDVLPPWAWKSHIYILYCKSSKVIASCCFSLSFKQKSQFISKMLRKGESFIKIYSALMRQILPNYIPSIWKKQNISSRRKYYKVFFPIWEVSGLNISGENEIDVKN